MVGDFMAQVKEKMAALAEDRGKGAFTDFAETVKTKLVSIREYSNF